MSNDYLLKVKIQNNKIVSLMRAKGYQTPNALSKACGVDATTIGAYINMTRSPVPRIGKLMNKKFKLAFWNDSAQKIADFLGVPPEEMFNEQQLYEPLETNQTEKTMSSEMLKTLMSTTSDNGDPYEKYLLEEESKSLLYALTSLSKREQKVINMRFGLNGEAESTLGEVGAVMGVNKERIRQIEAKALRKMYRYGAHRIEDSSQCSQ